MVGRGNDIETTTIDKLLETTELPENSLIHIVVKENDGYTSKRMTTANFKQKIYEAIQNTFKTAYWDTHTHSSEDEAQYSMPAILEYLDASSLAPTPTPALDDTPHAFVTHVNYDFEVMRRYVWAKDTDLQRQITKLDGRLIDAEFAFAPDMVLATTKLDNNDEVVDTNDSVNHHKTVDDTYCQMSISDGNKISNEWTVPQTGNLVIYGWLDSTAALNNKAIPSTFCALEGLINKSWEIISVQPILPAKNITYVGFTVPAKKDLQIRIRVGFTVGAKSGQYSNEQDGNDTLSNSTPNGFKCMVFANKSEEEENNGSN